MCLCHRIYVHIRTLRSRRIACALLGCLFRAFFDVLNYSSLSPVVATLHILSHLYVQRCFPLWKEHATWFSKTISEEFSTLPASSSNSDKRNAFYDQYEHSSLRYSVYRHILVLDAPFRRLVSFIPREVIEGKSLACDPLPPSTAQSHYDQEFFRGTEDIRSERRHNVVNQQLFDQLLGQHLQVGPNGQGLIVA